MLINTKFKTCITLAVIAFILIQADVSLAETTYYKYDGSGRLERVYHSNGNGTQYAYDDDGNLIQKQASITAVVPIYTVNTEVASGCGTVMPPGPLTLPQGSSQTFSFLPTAGSYLVDAQLDGVSIGIPSTYILSNISANHTLALRFIIPDGDINNNGIVDLTDANLALNIAVGTIQVTPLVLAHGDVAPFDINGVPAPNGVIDTSDALLILRKATGLISWNTTCVLAQQGLSANSTTPMTTTSAVQNSSSCSNYYNRFDEQALMGIFNMLKNADINGNDVVTNNGHSMVARKMSSCEIDLELYDDVAQENLLCTERISTCESVE